MVTNVKNIRLIITVTVIDSVTNSYKRTQVIYMSKKWYTDKYMITNIAYDNNDYSV